MLALFQSLPLSEKILLGGLMEISAGTSYMSTCSAKNDGNDHVHAAAVLLRTRRLVTSGAAHKHN